MRHVTRGAREHERPGDTGGPRVLLGLPAAGRRDEARILLDGGGVSVFLPASSISTFSPITPTRGGGGGSGLQASCFLHVPTVEPWEGFCFFQLKKKKRKFSKHTHFQESVTIKDANVSHEKALAPQAQIMS